MLWVMLWGLLGDLGGLFRAGAVVLRLFTGLCFGDVPLFWCSGGGGGLPTHSLCSGEGLPHSLPEGGD